MWQWPATSLPVDPRRALPVFTVQPNWKNGVLETLSWLTDVMVSETAVEQRRSVRRYPRRMFEAHFLRAGSNRSRLDLFLAGTGSKTHLVPLWHEQWRLKTDPLPGNVVQFPQGELAGREFRLNDLVLLTSGNPAEYDILTVTGVNVITDRLTLASPTGTRAWKNGVRITPLRSAKVLDAVKMSNVTDRVGSTGIRWQLTDADTSFPASWGYCSPLWRTRPDRRTPIEFEYNRNDYLLDMQGGVIETTDPGNRAEIWESFSIKLFGREAVNAFRAFLYAARGRAVRFYLPTFTNDIIPTTPLGGTTFDAQVNGFSDYVTSPQAARRMIGVYFSDGRPTVYRTITNVSAVMTGSPAYKVAERVTVDLAFPPIDRASIERISFVVPSRFDQDNIEIAHVTDSLAAVSSAVVMKSSIVDGMPPIDCWVTSKPYPVEAFDEMTYSGGPVGGTMWSPNFLDDMTYGGLPVDGQLRPILLPPYTTLPDEFNATGFAPIDGTLRSVVKDPYTMLPDEFNATGFAPSDGVIKTVVLPPYTMETDSINYSGAVLSGTLT